MGSLPKLKDSIVLVESETDKQKTLLLYIILAATPLEASTAL